MQRNQHANETLRADADEQELDATREGLKPAAATQEPHAKRDTINRCKKTYDAASEYIQLGLKVLPLHGITDGACTCGRHDCSSPGKHPLTKNGVKEATGDITTVEDWLQRWPWMNIGIACGMASNILVIDIDGETGEESLEGLIEEFYGELPETWEQFTGGGGRHLVFKRPAKAPNKVGVAPGVDVRGDDGYIVAEPSIHASGITYMWEAMHRPEEMDLAELPEAWLAMFQDKEYRKAEPLSDSFSEGQRNDLLFRLGASLRAKGLSESELEAALMEANRGRCVPPLEDREVKQIAHSCCRYAAGTPVAKIVQKPESPVDKADFAKLLSDAENLYTDDIIGAVVAMEDANSPEYFEALTALEKIKGYKKTNFDKAVRMYRNRQTGAVKAVDKDDNRPPIEKALHDIPVKGLVMPGEWILSGDGICRMESRKGTDLMTKVYACPHPIFPTERLYNIDTSTEKMKLTFRRDGKWHDIVVDKFTSSNRASIVNLANYGVQVTSESAKHLVTFLSEFETANKDKLPLKRSISRLGWINNTQFAPYDDSIVFDGAIAFGSTFDAVHTAGSLDEWKRAAMSARECLQLRVMLAASFAAPLVWAIPYQCFFVHLWGDSGAGKTVGTQFALSVWGDPTRLLRTFDSTAVGMERYAAFFHSLPYGIDELQTLNTKFMPTDQLVMKLSAGTGKTRGTRGGGIDKPTEWRLIFLTTGEEPLTKQNSQGGAKNRAIELYIGNGDYPNGLEPRQLVTVAMENYGHAGKLYIDGLMELMDGKKAYIKQLWQEIGNAIQDSNYTQKHLSNVATLALGDMLSSMLVFGMDEGRARMEALTMAVSVMERLETNDEVDPIRRAWDFVRGWITENIDHFKDDNTALDKKTLSPIYGKIERDVIYVIATSFRRALTENGFSPEKCLRGFKDKGLVSCGKDGKATRPFRIDGPLVRVVALLTEKEL